jgi:hypothetical protein
MMSVNEFRTIQNVDSEIVQSGPIVNGLQLPTWILCGPSATPLDDSNDDDDDNENLPWASRRRRDNNNMLPIHSNRGCVLLPAIGRASIMPWKMMTDISHITTMRILSKLRQQQNELRRHPPETTFQE